MANGATGAIDVTFPKLGRFPVTLTSHRPDGSSASHQTDVVVKDYLIVSIGDSVASGEGNPPDETGDQDAYYYKGALEADPAYGMPDLGSSSLTITALAPRPGTWPQEYDVNGNFTATLAPLDGGAEGTVTIDVTF